MNFKELVQGATDILEAEYSFDEDKNVYAVKISFEGSGEENVYVYQDIFESEDSGISKKIVVCESMVGKYSGSVNLLELSKSNNDLFFSRAYVSEDEKILVESCTYMESLDSLNLSAIIDEIAQHSNYLKEDIV